MTKPETPRLRPEAFIPFPGSSGPLQGPMFRIKSRGFALSPNLDDTVAWAPLANSRQNTRRSSERQAAIRVARSAVILGPCPDETRRIVHPDRDHLNHEVRGPEIQPLKGPRTGMKLPG